jgi:hypothetical protein
MLASLLMAAALPGTFGAHGVPGCRAEATR